MPYYQSPLISLMAKTQAQPPIHIREATDGDRKVILHPDSHDLFVLTGQQVISSCNLGISIDVWVREMESMFEFVAKWSADRLQVIESCYAIPRGTKMVLFFVPKSDAFDFDLADQLVDLNAHLLTEFNIGMIEVHQIPGKEVERFLNPDTARRIYGVGRESHQPMEA
jgi:hypothetical protein